MFDTALIQYARQFFGTFDRYGTHQHRLSCFVTLDNIFGNGVKLGIDRAIHKVIEVVALNRTVRWNCLHGKVIDLSKLRVLGHCSTRHARELVIKTEVVLERDCSERLVFLAHIYAFLGFNCLVKTLRIASTFHNTTGKFINNFDFAIRNNILLIAVKHILSFQRLLQVIDQLSAHIGIDVVDTQTRFDLLQTQVSRSNCMFSFVHIKVDFGA